MQRAGSRLHRLRPALAWIRGSHVPPGPSRPCARLRSSGPGIAPPNVPRSASLSTAAYSDTIPGVAGGNDPPSICILGGGFGGLYTAIRLESLMWPKNQKPRITLVDQNDRFVFKPLLYDLLLNTASEDEVAPEYSALLAPYNIRFIKSKVEEVTPAQADSSGSTAASPTGGVVTLADGLKLPYDWLVLSLGSDTNLEMVEGAAKHAIGFASLDDVHRVDAALSRLSATTADPSAPRPVVSVVGAGYAGVELAAAVAERMSGAAAVHLLSPSGGVMPGQAAPLVEAAEKELLQASVLTRTAKVQSVSEGRNDPACADIGKKLSLDIRGKRETEYSDLVLWTAGTKAATAQRKSGFPFPMNERGMTSTDATLRVPGHPHVFAIGDTAAALASAPDAAKGAPTAQVAMQQADYVAWNLWAAINGRTLLPFKYQSLGTMLTFGRSSGAVKLNLPLPSQLANAVSGSPLGPVVSAFGVQLNGGDDGVTVGGPLAAFVRRAAYWYRQPTNDQKLRVGASWVTAGLQEIQRAVPSSSDAGGSSSSRGAKASSGVKTPPDDTAVAAAAAEGAVPAPAAAVKTNSGRV